MSLKITSKVGYPSQNKQDSFQEVKYYSLIEHLIDLWAEVVKKG